MDYNKILEKLTEECRNCDRSICEACETNYIRHAVVTKIPREPISITYPPLIRLGWEYECPHCGNVCGTNRLHPDLSCRENYCSNCSQLLQWGLTKE